jgi:hypothetical protein
MYSTWSSGESAGYWDLILPFGARKLFAELADCRREDIGEPMPEVRPREACERCFCGPLAAELLEDVPAVGTRVGEDRCSREESRVDGRSGNGPDMAVATGKGCAN